MVDPAIEGFLNEHKEAWLKQKINSKTTDEEKAVFEHQAKVKFALVNWLPFEANRVKQIAITTHPAKFTHPGIKKDEISFTVNTFAQRNDGFLRSGNVRVELDAFGGAAGLIAYAFLTLSLKDGKTVLQHLEENTDELRQQLDITDELFDDVREKFLSVKSACNESDKTDRRLKQVYFPVDGDYHLLSVITPSGLIFKLKECINQMHFSDAAKEAREAKKNQKHHEQGLSEVFGLSVVGYGGTQPQNISVLNSQNFGTAYLLFSSPPSLAVRKIQPPRTNFFRDSLWLKPFKDDFQKFHDQLALDRNNIHVRQRRDWLIRTIIYQVADRIWTIRSLEPGWSESDNYQQLPEYQKIWLDQLHKARREDESPWFGTVQKELAIWFVRTYKKMLANQALSLGDDELPHIKKMIAECEEALR